MPRRKLKTKSNFGSVIWMIVLVGLGLGLLFGLGFGIWGYSQRRWDGKTRFTVVKLHPHVLVQSFDPQTQQGIELTLPDDLLIDSVGGRGPWAAGVLAQAGTSQWAADSVSDYLGISSLGSDTSLTWWDHWQLALKSRNVQWQKVDLGETRFVESQKLPDGVSVQRLSSNWDDQARTWFADQTIAQQVLGVSVVNTWERPGLGTNAGRVVESMGFKVRNLSTSEEKIDQCVVTTLPELKNSTSVERLIATFKCRWQAGTDPDIQLSLGKDYINWRWGN